MIAITMEIQEILLMKIVFIGNTLVKVLVVVTIGWEEKSSLFSQECFPYRAT